MSEADLDPALLAREGHGAIEVASGEDGPPPPIVVLAGPIRHWWQPGQWETPQHREYIQWRDAVRVALVKAGCLVYSPHRAIQGSWNDAAQAINDAAIRVADVVVVLTPPGTVSARFRGRARPAAAARPNRRCLTSLARYR